MSIEASPPPMPALNAEQEKMAEQLDEELLEVRAQIAALTKSRKLLASTLLNSTTVQERLQQSTTSDQALKLATERVLEHAQTNAYRLAFGVTAFPFTDPGPDTSNRPLLGIRFDLCQTNGQFDSPYYIICKRVSEESNELKIHRHTLPALIPLQDYEEKYLPVQDEGYGSEDSMVDTERSRQDLHSLVCQVRQDLVSWRSRQQAIEQIKQDLELPKRLSPDADDSNDEEEVEVKHGMYGVREFEPVGVDARFVRIVWENGRVGRIKISYEGTIERAVVFGNVDGKDQQCKDVERFLCMDNPCIEVLLERLKQLYQTTI